VTTEIIGWADGPESRLDGQSPFDVVSWRTVVVNSPEWWREAIVEGPAPHVARTSPSVINQGGVFTTPASGAAR
jgi:hypothetical protein